MTYVFERNIVRVRGNTRIHAENLKRMGLTFDRYGPHWFSILRSIEEIETGLPDLDVLVHFDWSPDGERFVFIGWKYGEKEFWFLENFLPLDMLPDQSGPELAAEPEEIRIKKVWESPYLEDLGRVSNDGRFRSCVDWGVGDLAIHDLKSGQISQLTQLASLGW